MSLVDQGKKDSRRAAWYEPRRNTVNQPSQTARRHTRDMANLLDALSPRPGLAGRGLG